LIKGAGAVLVSGCHPSDCHYNNANHNTAQRVERLWKRMERIGVNKNRVRLAWVSAAEGAQFARVIQEIAHALEELTPLEIRNDAEKLSELLSKKSESI
jgi:coenzyme F420-reducing hydrogenase delta subunit